MRVIIVFLIFIILMVGCLSKKDRQLEYVLQQAGNNRSELEEVLSYYKDDTLKLRATHFVIQNMLGHSGIDSNSLVTIQPLYDNYRILGEKYNWEQSPEWTKEAIQFWKDEKKAFANLKIQADIRSIKASWLINEIDRSFKAWKENVYMKDASFKEFCQYVLPYRFAEGVAIDNCRDTFYQRHSCFFNNPKIDFRKACDSLLYI